MNLEAEMERIRQEASYLLTCKTCHDRPFRTVYVDPVTEEAWEETMPAEGCPECGLPIAHEVVVMIGRDGSTEYPGDELV